MACDLKLGAGHNERYLAIMKEDRNLLFPVDHVLHKIQIGSCNQSLKLLKEMVCVRRGSSRYCNGPGSPLIRLLTLGTATGLRATKLEQAVLIQSKSTTLDNRRLFQVLQAAKLLLDEDPSLLYYPAKVSDCSPCLLYTSPSPRD